MMPETQPHLIGELTPNLAQTLLTWNPDVRNGVIDFVCKLAESKGANPKDTEELKKVLDYTLNNARSSTTFGKGYTQKLPSIQKTPEELLGIVLQDHKVEEIIEEIDNTFALKIVHSAFFPSILSRGVLPNSRSRKLYENTKREMESLLKDILRPGLGINNNLVASSEADIKGAIMSELGFGCTIDTSRDSHLPESVIKRIDKFLIPLQNSGILNPDNYAWFYRLLAGYLQDRKTLLYKHKPSVRTSKILNEIQRLKDELPKIPVLTPTEVSPPEKARGAGLPKPGAASKLRQIEARPAQPTLPSRPTILPWE